MGSFSSLGDRGSRLGVYTKSLGSNLHYISRAFKTTHTPESVEKSESLSVRALGVGSKYPSVQQEEPVRPEPDNIHGDRQIDRGAEQHQHQDGGQQGRLLAWLHCPGSWYICPLQLPHKMVAPSFSGRFNCAEMEMEKCRHVPSSLHNFGGLGSSRILSGPGDAGRPDIHVHALLPRPRQLLHRILHI